jgi:CBS domain-containing membrane protein
MNFSSLRTWLGVQPPNSTPKETLRTLGGGVFSICLLLAASTFVFQKSGSEWLVASMGASVVLLKCAPQGPLSQPWPVIAGHTVSALIGVCCAKWISAPVPAAGLAVGLAMVAMQRLGCLHPPGGATALTAVVAGPHIRELGFGFVWSPVFLNACTVTLAAALYHRVLGKHHYPAGATRRGG